MQLKTRGSINIEAAWRVQVHVQFHAFQGPLQDQLINGIGVAQHLLVGPQRTIFEECACPMSSL